MIEWRFLAAIFGILLFFTSVFMGIFDFRSLLSKGFGGMGEWMKNSPFSGILDIFSRPGESIHEVDIYLYPKNLSLNLKENANITLNSTKISNFKGEINIDFVKKEIELRYLDSPFELQSTLENVKIENVKIKEMEFRNLKMNVVSKEWNSTSENGTIKILDFIGDSFISNGYIELKGNVSKLLKKGEF